MATSIRARCIPRPGAKRETWVMTKNVCQPPPSHPNTLCEAPWLTHPWSPIAKAGPRVYPRQVGQGGKPPRDPAVQAALDAIPECATSNAGSSKWFEFPITNPTFAGCPDQGYQGPDRVLAILQNIGPGGGRVRLNIAWLPPTGTRTGAISGFVRMRCDGMNGP